MTYFKPGTKVRVYCDWGGTGIWAYDPDEREDPEYGVSYESIGLPPDLANRFAAWAEAYRSQPNDGPSDLGPEWLSEGRDLAQQLKRHLGPDVPVYLATDVEDEEINE